MTRRDWQPSELDGAVRRTLAEPHEHLVNGRPVGHHRLYAMAVQNAVGDVTCGLQEEHPRHGWDEGALWLTCPGIPVPALTGGLTIWTLDGDALERLRQDLDGARTFRIAVDENTLKFKVNEGAWTPGLDPDEPRRNG